MNRRHFIQASSFSLASILLSDSVFANRSGQPIPLINFPDSMTALIDGKMVTLLSKDRKRWVYHNLEVTLQQTAQSMAIGIKAPASALSHVNLHWKKTTTAARILNDHWERTYGDVSWHKQSSNEQLPWYFLEQTASGTNGFGVKTAASAFCYWQLGNAQVNLIMDTNSGGNGVQLGDRTLTAAEIVTIKGNRNESSFKTLQRFNNLMCGQPRLAKQPVYGINDWYFTYGNTSAALIMQHTELMAPMAEGLDNRPFSVIDAGWFEPSETNPQENSFGYMGKANKQFPDMAKLAADIKKIGMRPGLWTRPLCGVPGDAASLFLPTIPGRDAQHPIIDPTIPENQQRIRSFFKLYNDWGFEMVKFDFTTYDLLGKWGFEMMKDRSMTSPGWNFYDKTRTNAEVIHELYKLIRASAKETYIISCNTISHLCAGLFELNRVGDDTSGREWARTRRMGVNTLAFRGAQQGTFYSADGDCVGLTDMVPWEKNKQWMELVARSGTPLFISAQPNSVGAEQKKAIKQAFEWASIARPVAEPLDWKETAFPRKWNFGGEMKEFNWD